MIDVIDNFVALDTSTTSMAFAFFSNRHLDHFGIIAFNGSGIYQKVADAAKKTESFLEIWSPDVLVIESSFYSANPRTATNLALMQGSILGAASVVGVKHLGSVTPLAWQNGIGNHPLTSDEKNAIIKQYPGKSPGWYKSKQRLFRKQRTIDIVNKHFKVDISDDNIADACGLGLYVCDHQAKVNWE